MAQDKSEIAYLKEVFKLSEGEANFLVTCLKGEGLLKVGQDTAILQIVPTVKGSSEGGGVSLRGVKFSASGNIRISA